MVTKKEYKKTLEAKSKIDDIVSENSLMEEVANFLLKKKDEEDPLWRQYANIFSTGVFTSKYTGYDWFKAPKTSDCLTKDKRNHFVLKRVYVGTKAFDEIKIDFNSQSWEKIEIGSILY